MLDEDLVLDAGDAASSDARVMAEATSDLTGLSGWIVSSGRRVRTQSQQIARRSKYHSCLGLKDG